MKRCPECGGTRFYSTAFLSVTWLIDEKGDFVEQCDNITVDAAPDDSGIWECAECGFSADGEDFNCEEGDIKA